VEQVPYYYQRKQTLTNAERYITPELKDIESKILTANERLIKLEAELYNQVRDSLLPQTGRLEKDARLISRLDVYASFAQVAVTNRYVRPEMGDDGIISIRNGRHPIVERSLQDGFIPNDVLLDRGENRLLIITGPNMAGKSTYMRMTALIALMAHMGSFVPAEAAHVCLVDRIFTRIGASDDLSSGQSTFMVEMSEVANILNNATRNSLLILDEIGRGTSTYDGLSIAWAVLEFIASEQTCGSKALFATHYHELSELEGRLSGVKNYRISVKEIGEDILFLRKIVRGSADKSFGVQVARLAGIPNEVILRAGQILQGLENTDMATMHTDARIKTVDKADLSVDKSDKAADNPVDKAILADLKALNLENMTPMMALQKLYSYRDAFKED
jgi:DNA mismatch repair protein MutS